MYGPQERKLKDLYQRMGMTPFQAPADYLGSMLECLALLNAEPDVGRAFWTELWDRHLGRWVPRFCRELQAESKIVLYRIMAERLCILFPEVKHTMTAVA